MESLSPTLRAVLIGACATAAAAVAAPAAAGTSGGAAAAVADVSRALVWVSPVTGQIVSLRSGLPEASVIDELGLDGPELGLPLVLDAETLPFPMTLRRSGRTRFDDWEDVTLVVEVELDADGRPLQARVAENPAHRAFDRAAVRAAMGWQYAPATLDGRPVSATALVPVQFTTAPATPTIRIDARDYGPHSWAATSKPLQPFSRR